MLDPTPTPIATRLFKLDPANPPQRFLLPWWTWLFLGALTVYGSCVGVTWYFGEEADSYDVEWAQYGVGFFVAQPFFLGGLVSFLLRWIARSRPTDDNVRQVPPSRDWRSSRRRGPTLAGLTWLEHAVLAGVMSLGVFVVGLLYFSDHAGLQRALAAADTWVPASARPRPVDAPTPVIRRRAFRYEYDFAGTTYPGSRWSFFGTRRVADVPLAKTRVIVLDMDPNHPGEIVDASDLSKRFQPSDPFVVYVDPDNPRASVCTFNLPMPRAQFERHLRFLLIAMLGAAGLASFCTYAAVKLSRQPGHHVA